MKVRGPGFESQLCHWPLSEPPKWNLHAHLQRGQSQPLPAERWPGLSKVMSVRVLVLTHMGVNKWWLLWQILLIIKISIIIQSQLLSQEMGLWILWLDCPAETRPSVYYRFLNSSIADSQCVLISVHSTLFSYAHICIFSYSFPLWFITRYWVWFSEFYSRTMLFIYFEYSGLYLLIPHS